MRTSSATATTGATGFSRTMTVKPLSSRSVRTVSAGGRASAGRDATSIDEQQPEERGAERRFTACPRGCNRTRA